MKCTYYGLYGQLAVKNERAILKLNVGLSGQHISGGICILYDNCVVGMPRGARG